MALAQDETRFLRADGGDQGLKDATKPTSSGEFMAPTLGAGGQSSTANVSSSAISTV